MRNALERRTSSLATVLFRTELLAEEIDNNNLPDLGKPPNKHIKIQVVALGAQNEQDHNCCNEAQ